MTRAAPRPGRKSDIRRALWRIVRNVFSGVNHLLELEDYSRGDVPRD